MIQRALVRNVKSVFGYIYIRFQQLTYSRKDTVSLSVSERSFEKRDPSLWTSPEKFVVLGDQT